MFSKAIAEKLAFYVYRLIDPRTGETFYVGRGKGNRVFEHARGEPGTGADELTDKLKIIRDIRKDDFEVGHIIHRHGMDEQTVIEVEAALIDAYPQTTNLVAGAGSDERGVMHSKQIIERYEAPEASFNHRVVMISINRSVAERASVYEAVRYAWKIDPAKAASAELVLAVEQGLIIGVFIADRWLEATPENFPGTAAARPGRYGFVGSEAPELLAVRYRRHRVPDQFRRRGAANPIRYAP